MVNLFDISNNFNRPGTDWLMQRFVNDTRKDGGGNTPHTPAPTMAARQTTKSADGAKLTMREKTRSVDKPTLVAQEVTEKGPSR